MGSVLWVREKSGGKSGGQDERGRSSYHNEWTVKCDSPTMTRAEVLNCGLLPIYGSPNAENLMAVCVKTDARRQANAPCYWDVVADWQESPLSGRDPADEQKQPDQRRPRWSSRYIPIPVSRFVDYGGGSDSPMLLTDTAGTPFDPVPDMPIYCEEITVNQYEATAARTTKRGFMGRTNTDVWCGAAVGEALVDDIQTGDEFIKGVYWWNTTYKILIKPRAAITLPGSWGTTYVGGFDPEYVLNAGPLAWKINAQNKWEVLPATRGTTDNASDGSGFYDGRPSLLDTDGTEILRNATTHQLVSAPVFLKFHTKQTAAFSGLNLTPPDGWNT